MSTYISISHTISNISADISVVVSFETSTNADDVVINSTNFPDENFQNWILNNIEAAKDGVLTASEMESITYIDCSGQQIQSLKGIENFTSLDNLYCQFNQLTNIDVSKNTALINLICYHNQLTDLDVTHNTLLRALTCGENQLTSLDLNHNTDLSYLDCGYNELTSLDLSHNSALTTLTCTSNKLTSLDLSHNPLLKGELRCGHNQLTSLDLENFTEFEFIECEYNQLSTLDVSKNTALGILNCAHNQLTFLDVSHNTALTVLYAGDNELLTLDVSNNTSLIQLSVDFNQLTSLDISHNSALEVLTCWANQLTFLDLSQNTALTRLDCMVNYLTSLDLSKNTALTDLRCEYNQIYDLDLSNNTLLTNYSVNSPQWADLTYDYINGLNVQFHYVSIRALDIPEGIAIPVPSTFDISKVSDLMLDGTAVQGSIVNKNGLKFLVFVESGINPSCQMMLSYSYDTGNSTVGLMTVNVPITYTGTATVWTDPDTNHSWVYSSSDANASIDRNAWAAGDITVPSIINGNTVNNIDFKAFYGCSGITSLTIPSTVIHMCDYVVNGCHKLKKLIVLATTPPVISDVTFMDYDIPLYVPEEAVDTYKKTSTWKNFKSIRALSTVNQHNLIYIVDGEAYKSFVLNEGESIAPESEPTKEGYAFSGWSEIPTTMPDHDVTVTGTFVRVYNVGDVANVVNFIMNANAQSADIDLYDMNNDDELNIGDIILIVKWILNNAGNGGNAVRRRASEIIDITQYTAAQFEIKLPATVKVKDIRLVNSMNQSHQIMYKQLDGQTYAVVVYSPTNQLMVPDHNNIVVVETEGTGLENLMIQNATFAKPNGEITSYDGTFVSTGVEFVQNDENPAVIYDLKGIRHDNDNNQKKGVYIINGKKVVVK